MNRLTLPRQPQSIDFRQCLPAGDSMPSWSNLPLDTKLPMYKPPKGQLTLYTTQVSEPKYRSNQSIEFDLSDPNGMSSSTEYHSLHDPHLKSLFSLPSMRRHLVRNGFITPSGEVICTLKEFNKYRQYLRRLCLLEQVTQERKEELAKIEMSHKLSAEKRVKQEISSKFLEVKQRHNEILEKLKQRHEELALQDIERADKRIKAQEERVLLMEEKRKLSETRRDEILLRHKHELEKKNIELLQKWIVNDIQRERRVEEQKADVILRHTRRNVEKWQNRKLHESQRLAREKEIREQETETIDENILIRQKRIKKLHKYELAQIESLKKRHSKQHENRELLYAQRLARKLVTGNIHSSEGSRRKLSEYNSVWHFEQIIRLLDISNGSDDSQTRTTSLDFLRSSNYTIDPSKYKKMYMFDDHTKHTEGHPSTLIRQDSDSEAELSNFVECDSRRRSVRFNSDEHIIPGLLSGTLLTPGASLGSLKPVSEHVLTPVPSPVPPEFFHRDSLTLESTRDDVSLVETLLLRLLDDLNNQRLSRVDLQILTSYCLQVLKSHDLVSKIDEIQKQNELKMTTSSEVANDLVQFTLVKILNDISTGCIENDDLTAITLALVSQRQQLSPSPLEDDIRGHILDTLNKIEREEGIESFVSESLNKVESDERLDNFISMTLNQVLSDIKNDVLTEEDLTYMGMAVTATSNQNLAKQQTEILISESEMKASVEKIINSVSSTQLKEDNTLYAIISSYHIVNKRNKESVKEFLYEICPKVCAGMKMPESDRVKKNIKEFKKELKEGCVSDYDIQSIGTKLINIGKKCLPPAILDASESFKDLTRNIKRVLDRNEFRKEAEKTMCEYFVKDKNQRSNSSAEGHSSLYTPTSESKIAVNAVLGTMDRITRDVYTNNIPSETLSALATGIFNLALLHDTIIDPTECTSRKNGMQILHTIYQKFRTNKISFKDSKRLFATIFQVYVDPNTVDNLGEFMDISPEDRALIGNVIDETITLIVQTVALQIKQSLSDEEVSIVEIEDLVREELHGLGDDNAQPLELSKIEGNLDEVLQGCLTKAARDIAKQLEGVDSNISVESKTKLSDICFVDKVVDFILSAFDHLLTSFKSGTISSQNVIGFLHEFFGSGLDNLSDYQLQRLLEEIRLNIEQNREDSKYFSKLVTIFSKITLEPKSTSSDLNAINKILMSIDVQVLIEFVQAAMLSVLSYIQAEQTASKDLPIKKVPSLHRVESLLILRRVIDQVIHRVSEVVRNNDGTNKKSGSKSIFKRFSSKKLDTKDTRSLNQCVLDAFRETTLSMGHDHQSSQTPKILASTDERVMTLVVEISTLMSSLCDQCIPPSENDDLKGICNMMKDIANDMMYALGLPDCVSFETPISQLKSEHIEQYTLRTILSLLDQLYPDPSVPEASSMSALSSKSSQMIIDIFAQVLNQTIHNIRTETLPFTDLVNLVNALGGEQQIPKQTLQQMDSKKLAEYAIGYLTEFNCALEAGNLDENTMEEVTKQIAMMNIAKARSNENFGKSHSGSNVSAVPSQEIETMIKSVLSTITRDSEFSILQSAQDIEIMANPEPISKSCVSMSTSSVCSVPSKAIEIMVKSVLSSIIADSPQKATPEAALPHSFVTFADTDSSKSATNNEPSITTLKPILGSHPLEINEDEISAALSAITMKNRASHHCPPEHEPRQSYRSLVCPDIRDNQTKGKVTALIGTDKAGSGAVVVVPEESEGSKSFISGSDSDTFEIIGSNEEIEEITESTDIPIHKRESPKHVSSTLIQSSSPVPKQKSSETVNTRSVSFTQKPTRSDVQSNQSISKTSSKSVKSDKMIHKKSSTETNEQGSVKRTSSESVSKMSKTFVKESTTSLRHGTSDIVSKNVKSIPKQTSVDSITRSVKTNQKSSDFVSRSSKSIPKQLSTDSIPKSSNTSFKRTSSDAATKGNKDAVKQQSAATVPKGAGSVESKCNSSSLVIKREPSITIEKTSNISFKTPEVMTKSSSVSSRRVSSEASTKSITNIGTKSSTLKQTLSTTSKPSTTKAASTNTVTQPPSKTSPTDSVSTTSSEKETKDEVRGSILSDSSSHECHKSNNSSQTDATEVRSLCGSHRSSIVVRESDESLKSN